MTTVNVVYLAWEQDIYSSTSIYMASKALYFLDIRHKLQPLLTISQL